MMRDPILWAWLGDHAGVLMLLVGVALELLCLWAHYTHRHPERWTPTHQIDDLLRDE